VPKVFHSQFLTINSQFFVLCRLKERHIDYLIFVSKASARLAFTFHLAVYS